MKFFKSKSVGEYDTMKRRNIVYMPVYLLVFILFVMAGTTAGSIYWVFKKDNLIERERRSKIYLQNQIKEREIRLQQARQEINQLKRRVEIFDAIQELSHADLPENEKRMIAKEVDTASQKFGHDPLLLLALMSTESSLRPAVQSHVGAHGLMQLMPSTGRMLSRQIKESPELIGLDTINELEMPQYHNIQGNITLGTLYLTKLMLKYRSLEKAIYAYNLGPGLFEERQKNGGPMPTNYLRKIMSRYNQLAQRRDLEPTMPFIYALDQSHLIASKTN